MNAFWWEMLFGAPPKVREIVSLVGAGGKTTLLYTLARELAEAGFAPAVATTTKIYAPTPEKDLSVLTEGDLSAVAAALQKGKILVVGTPWAGGKFSCPTEETMLFLHEHADFLLLEADGSNRLPVKMPRDGEPVLWQGGGRVVALCGLSCIGQPLERVCHRASLAVKVLGCEQTERLTQAHVAKLLYAAYGAYGDVVFLLNQADDEAQRAQGMRVARLLEEQGAHHVVLGSLLRGWAQAVGSER